MTRAGGRRTARSRPLTRKTGRRSIRIRGRLEPAGTSAGSDHARPPQLDRLRLRRRMHVSGDLALVRLGRRGKRRREWACRHAAGHRPNRPGSAFAAMRVARVYRPTRSARAPRCSGTPRITTWCFPPPIRSLRVRRTRICRLARMGALRRFRAATCRYPEPYRVKIDLRRHPLKVRRRFGLGAAPPSGCTARTTRRASATALATGTVPSCGTSSWSDSAPSRDCACLSG
jgi:hypothetical protein